MKTSLLFVEVFSGTGLLSKAFHRLGYQIIEWDVQHGPEYDLLKVGPRRSLLNLVQGAHHVHIALPCSSFSIARGAGAPRSRQHPLGKPNLSVKDQQKVDDGNVLLRYSCKLISRCIALGTSAC